MLPVEFSQKEHFDFGSGLFFVAIEPGWEDLGIVKDKKVVFVAQIKDVLEGFVLDVSCFSVEYQ
ncbi:hypothetical protein SDC9_159863 [bioreactor metagenome]|uniref:Uncharacterized protein n=1 Tax=bioreactor metagenome TaxID=1076179 RepID=A0A645FDS0_9ZZZZ